MLEVATEGCCKGHKCDNCATCRKGRCCRRDNPDYTLPELGDWDGPISGELGVLNDDGEKVECHCCGKWFLSLGTHIYAVHDLTAREYKSIFGLNQKQGLIGPPLWQRHHDSAKANSLLDHSGKRLKTITPEQRSAAASGPRSLQFRLAYPQMHGSRRLSKSGFIGVPIPVQGNWQARMYIDGKIRSLGRYATAEAAARAYDAKARELYGDQARLNFPDEF